MDSSWCPAAQSVPSRPFLLAVASALAGLMVLLWSLESPVAERAAPSPGMYGPPYLAWYLAAGSGADRLSHGQSDGSEDELFTPSVGSFPMALADDGAYPSQDGTITAYSRTLLDLVNAERRAHGCQLVKPDPRLHHAAREHVGDMAANNYLAHYTLEGTGPGSRMLAAGYQWGSWGENVLRGSRTPSEAMEEWMSSLGHRRNILDCSWTDVGIGVAPGPGGLWWVQDFAARD
ncbi:CAP domain-containing protein [Streptomyces syringium]|uniref:CAP domain-containing protein n=1 Tax=Streptomyces syringium TaxID=76729 RepID=UPI00342DC40E